MIRDFLPYNLPSIDKDEINEVIDTLESGWLTMGPKTAQFEALIAKYTGATHAIAVNSCTAALHLSLISLGIGSGDEVITTPYTFAATGNVILNSNAKPKFVDITRDTYNINTDKLQEAITPKTRAIIPIHYAGHPYDIKAIKDISEDYDIYIIEDAAHAIGSEYNNKKIGNFGTTTCFSFYATKNITTGDGGAITTEDGNLADKLRILRLHGISKNAWNRYSERGEWYYEIEEQGWKYNMTDIQASLGIHQLKKLENFIDKRRYYASCYNDYFSKVENLIIPVEKENVKHVYHIYPLLLKDYDRNNFIQEMHKRRIGCSVHFIPLHIHPLYKNLGYKYGDFPIAEWVYEHEVSLPLYPKMTLGDIDYVIKSVIDIVG